MPLTIAATGHRPDKLLGFSEEAHARLTAFAKAQLLKHEAARVISGMALGWDTAVAQAALDLGLPLVCAIPCPQQPSQWPPHSIARWAKIKAAASEVYIISPSYSRAAMERRNRWMVDHAQAMLVLHNGSRGGTANCIYYATGKGLRLIRVWSEFKKECL